MAGTEDPVTAEDILEFLGKNAAAGIVSWAATKAFTSLIGAYDLSDVERELNTILENQRRILEGLEDLKLQVEWESLADQAKQAVDTIDYCSTRLHQILELKKSERKGAAEELMRRVLSDREDGMRPALESLHDVLQGNGPFVERGFLKLFFARLDTNLKRWSSGLTTLQYIKSYKAFLDGVSHLQLMGLTVLISAYNARGKGTGLSDAQLQVKNQFKRMTEQMSIVTSTVSDGWKLFEKHHESFLFCTPHDEFMTYGVARSDILLSHAIHPNHYARCKLTLQKSGEYNLIIDGHIVYVANGVLVTDSYDRKVLQVRPIPYLYKDGRYLACALLTPSGYVASHKNTQYPYEKTARVMPHLYAWKTKVVKDIKGDDESGAE